MTMRTLFVLVSLLLFVTRALAHDAKVGDLVVMEPWARATIGQVKTAAAYLTIINHGAVGDRLLAVSTPIAETTQIHSTAMDEGVMKMRPVDAIDIGAKDSTILKPGGLHVMLMGVQSPLKEGNAFPLTLTFEKAGSVDVEVHVYGVAAMQPGHGMEEGHAGHGEHQEAEHHESAGSHDHGAHQHDEVIELAGGPTAPNLDFTLVEDEAGGWNLHVMTTNFRFAPEHVNQPHRDGEGHAHLYVNGKKVARLYGPWLHIGTLPSGQVELTVTLNSNDHSSLMVDGEELAITKTVHIH